MACLFAVCAVLVVAAASKLRSPGVTRTATEELGVAPSLAPLVAPIELATAALLLLRPSLGAACAVLLFSSFTVALVRVVRSGRTVRCGCFGASTSAPVTAVTLLRNGALIAASAVAGVASPVAGVASANVVASGCVALGIVSAGVLLLALADLRRLTGAVFPAVRSEV